MCNTWCVCLNCNIINNQQIPKSFIFVQKLVARRGDGGVWWPLLSVAGRVASVERRRVSTSHHCLYLQSALGSFIQIDPEHALCYWDCVVQLTSKSGPGYDKRFSFSISSLNFLQTNKIRNIILAERVKVKRSTYFAPRRDVAYQFRAPICVSMTHHSLL